MTGRPVSARDVGREFLTAFNERRLADAEAMLARDCTFVAHGREAPREAFVAVMKLLHETFSDARMDLEEEVATADAVVQAVTFRGRHTGRAYLGIEPLGNEVAVHQIWILRISGNLIDGVREEWDALGCVRQMRGEPDFVP